MSARPAARRGRRLLVGTAAASLAVALAACTPAPSPPAGSLPLASATLFPTGTGALHVGGLPALLLIDQDPAGGGPRLLLTPPGEPGTQVALRLPAGRWRPGAALGAGGTILLTEPGSVFVGRLVGDRVERLWSRPVSPAELGGSSAPPGPACLADASLVAVFADGLVVLGPHGPARGAAAREARGDCAMPDPSELLYETEATHLLAALTVATGAMRTSTSECDGMAVGGPITACLLGSGEAESAAGVWARRAILGGHPALGALLVRLPATADHTAVELRLTRDGRWLALMEQALAGPPQGGHLRLFERDGAGFQERGGLDLSPGLLVVGFVEP